MQRFLDLLTRLTLTKTEMRCSIKEVRLRFISNKEGNPLIIEGQHPCHKGGGEWGCIQCIQADTRLIDDL